MKYTEEYSSVEKQRIESNFRRLNGNKLLIKNSIASKNCFSIFISDIHYLDHAGATQYAENQIKQIHSDLISNVYFNPHTNKLTEDHIDQVRYKILDWFNTTSAEYAVIFTGGSTASLKIVAETFDFGDSSSGQFFYLRDNHTSVLGMRELVKTKNIICVERDQFMSAKHLETVENNGNSLLVYPAQCNFNGFKYPLAAINEFQTANGSIPIEISNRYVYLDAAAFVSTNPLDLSKWRPDFVCLSFYKMFGYPTGLGALIVSRRGEKCLNKSYYGGGTVKICLSNASGWHRTRDTIHERYLFFNFNHLKITNF